MPSHDRFTGAMAVEDGEEEADGEPSLGFLENHLYPTLGSLHLASRDRSGGRRAVPGRTL